MRVFLAFLIIACWSSHRTQATAQTTPLSAFEYGDVQLEPGELKVKADAEKEFYLNLSNDDLLKGFRQRAGLPAPGKGLSGWYQADIFHVFGQLLSGYSRFYAATGDVRCLDKATYLFKEWSRTIREDGYFFYSNYPNDFHYTYEKMLGGVLDYYLFCNRNQKVLDCMRKITDWAVANLDRSRPLQGFYPGEWYTLSENLYRAYQVTHDQVYADFASVWEYPEFWEPIRTNGNPFSKEPALHAYSHLNTLCGAAAAFKVHNKKEYLQTCIAGYDFFRNNQCLVTGGFGIDEKILRPSQIPDLLAKSDNSFEVHCSCWACFKLGKYLISFTGDARYGDWVELMMINGIGANIPMTQDGKNYHYANYNPSGASKTNHTDGWWCCTGTRPQAFADLSNLIWFHNNDDLYLNLFVPSSLNWKGLRVIQQTDFPKSSKTSVYFQGTVSAPFAFGFRKPEWLAAEAVVKVNGEMVIPTEKDHWLIIERTWSNNDRIEIDFPMTFTVAPLPKGKAYPAALKYGPVTMAVQNAVQYPVDALTAHKTSLNDGQLSFEVEGHPEWKLIPYYLIGPDERCCVYLDPATTYRVMPNDIRNSGNWEHTGLWCTRTIGNSVEADFEGTGIRWKGFSFDDAGMVDIYIDGIYVTTADQYSSQRDTPFMWEKRDLSSGKHTLKLLLSETKNPKSRDFWMNYAQFLYYSEGISNITSEQIKPDKKITLIHNELHFDSCYLSKQIGIAVYNLLGELLYLNECLVDRETIALPVYDGSTILVVWDSDKSPVFRTKVLR